MKYSNAVKIVDKLVDNDKPVKVKKSKYGGLSSVTWYAICNVLIDKGFKKVSYTIHTDKIVLSADNNFISDKIVLF